jgi:lysophospholipase L1-like esterase
MGDIRSQLTRLAPDSTVILSVGGNDAAAHIGLLDQRGTNSGEVFGQLLQIADDFERQYEAAARSVASHAKRTVLCTIYEVQLEPPVFAKLARVPLAVLNDRIIRTGSRLGLDVLELRTVCTEPDDFTLQIEPSAQGAEKIARAIARLVDGEPGLRSSRVFAA